MKPKKIYSKHIPFKGYTAITLFFVMIVRSEYKGRLPWFVEIHENIHFAQYIDLLFVLFIPLYVLEFLLKLAATFSWKRAYESVSFEQEAYSYQFDKAYLENRRHYAWLKYVFKLKPKK